MTACNSKYGCCQQEMLDPQQHILTDAFRAWLNSISSDTCHISLKEKLELFSHMTEEEQSAAFMLLEQRSQEIVSHNAEITLRLKYINLNSLVASPKTKLN